MNRYKQVSRCTIADITPGGARIVVFNSLELPDLVKISTPFFRTPRPARVSWRKAKEIGVRFLDDFLGSEHTVPGHLPKGSVRNTQTGSLGGEIDTRESKD